MKVLVSDKLGAKGLRILKNAKKLRVEEKVGLPAKELKRIIKNYDGIVVRSGTQLTRDILNSAKKLKVIGRAGVGVDNVDLKAATKLGIIVMNTPEANTVSTCELTFSMMMALSRNIPQAHAHVKDGGWNRGKFVGQELFGKKLGILGFGRIGREIAKRAIAFGMEVLIYDPFISKEFAENYNVQSVTLEKLCKQADYITVHMPLTPDTTHIINKETFKLMKKGVCIINCARGGIVNEKDLYDALKSGKVKGAALDVFETEPPKNSPLFKLNNVIATPHLGASTPEAQENVAVAVAEQVRDALLEQGIRNAVNLPSMDERSAEVLQPWVHLAEKMGSLQSQLLDKSVKRISIRYSGEVTDHKLAPLTLAFLKGFLKKALGERVNYVNAPILAKERGITVVESKTSKLQDFANFISVEIKNGKEKHSLIGTLFADNKPRIVRFNDYYIDANPEGEMLFVSNQDKPGVIGEVCVRLGKNRINIAEMALGRTKAGGQAITVFNVDQPVSDRVLKALKSIPKVINVKSIKL